MKIDRKYLWRYYHNAAVDQLRDEYVRRGYTVMVEKRIGEFRFDMIAKKKDDTIFFEVKTGEVRAEVKKRIRNMSDFIKQEYPNSRFLLVVVNYPEDTVKIENIEQLIFDYFMCNGTPSELDELSLHTTINEVSDVVVNGVKIGTDAICFECEGTMVIEIEYDTKENELTSKMSFPFTMKGVLGNDNKKMEIKDLEDLRIDTDEFYGKK